MWESESLWSKSKLYMERALGEERASAEFPFWTSLALEFLARAAVAKVHPVLLAKPDEEMVSVLFALGRPVPKRPPRSVGAFVVFKMCKHLVSGFGGDEFDVCVALADRRNEELHGGGRPFEEFPTSGWLRKFYKTAKVLTGSLDRSLVDFLGDDEAAAAEMMLVAEDKELARRVRRLIAERKSFFEELEPQRRTRLLETGSVKADAAASQGGHRVTCPACGGRTFVTGEVIASQRPILNEEGQLVLRESMLPTNLDCLACELKLASHAELDVAAVGGQFTRTTWHDPVTYYGGEYPGSGELPEEEYDNE